MSSSGRGPGAGAFFGGGAVRLGPKLVIFNPCIWLNPGILAAGAVAGDCATVAAAAAGVGADERDMPTGLKLGFNDMPVLPPLMEGVECVGMALGNLGI